MDARYRLRQGELKDEVVRRLAAGEEFKTICAGDGMPCEATVMRWRRVDPVFAGEVEQARARARLRTWAYDPKQARALLDRCGAGERIVDLLREPGMPNRATYQRWLAEDYDFAEQIRLHRANVASRRACRLRARHRPFDQDVADKIIVGLNRTGALRKLLNSRPDLPSATIVARWRRENAEFDLVIGQMQKAWIGRRARERLFSDELAHEIWRRILMGASLNSLSKEPDMPCARTLYKWVNRREAFAQDIRQACEDREDWYVAQIMRLAETATYGRIGETRRQIGQLKRQLTRLRNRPGKRYAR